MVTGDTDRHLSINQSNLVVHRVIISYRGAGMGWGGLTVTGSSGVLVDSIKSEWDGVG